MENCKKFVDNVIDNWNEEKIINPFTKRKINFYTKTFNTIKNQCETYTNCNQIGLKNLSNTCYLDSVLFVLLAVQNKYIDKYILFKEFNDENISNICGKNLNLIKKFQSELRKLTFEFRNAILINDIPSCKNFINIYKSCINLIYPNFSNKNIQRDAQEFMSFIIALFNFDSNFYSIIEEKKRFKKNKNSSRFTKVSKVVSEHNLVTWQIPYFTFEDKNNIELSSLLKYSDSGAELEDPYFFDTDTHRTNPFYFYVSETKLRKLPPYLIFTIERVNKLNLQFNDNNIIPESYIKDLKLFGIIVQLGFSGASRLSQQKMSEIGGGHYISYVLCDKNWYEYDDLSPKIKKVGSYEKLLKKTNVCNRGVMYFYSRF